MRILGYAKAHSGVDYHRVVNPMLYLHGNEGRIEPLKEEVLSKGWDIVIFNRNTNLDLQELLYYRELYGFKLVCDVDDYWELNPLHILNHSYNAGQIGSKIKAHMMAADLVTVTHERLKDKAKEFNNNVEVLPNCLPYGDGQFTDNKIGSDKVRLFWAGGITHAHDMELLRNPLRKVFADKIRNEIEMVMGGYSKNPAYDRMLSAFTNGLKLRHRVYAGLETTKYMALYQDADIVLVPLVANEFNSYKSIIKILEAAAKKLPVIVSKVEPYTQVPERLVNFVEKQSDWYKHIKRLVNDPEERKQQGENLYQWAIDNYNLFTFNKVRQEVYDRTIKSDTGKALRVLGDTEGCGVSEPATA